MFRKLAKFKSKKAQNTAEYALLISLVVAGIIAMQTFAQRALQARIHDTSNYMAQAIQAEEAIMGTTLQYEPDYLRRGSVTGTEGKTTERLLTGGATDRIGFSNRLTDSSYENVTYTRQ